MKAVSVASALLVAAVCAVTGAAAPPQSGKTKSVAQKLVEDMLSKHPEADEIGISAVSPHGCRTIASTDSGDIGEVCEKDDSEPMRTGKPYVEKEKNGFDISVPLHDSAGKLIGSVGIGFKPHAGQTEAVLVEQARKLRAGWRCKSPRKRSFSSPQNDFGVTESHRKPSPGMGADVISIGHSPHRQGEAPIPAWSFGPRGARSVLPRLRKGGEP